MNRYDYDNEYKSNNGSMRDGIYSKNSYKVLVFGNGKFRLYSDGDCYIYENGRSVRYRKEVFKFKWRLYNTKLREVL